MANHCNWLWGRLFLPIIGIRLSIEYKYKPDPKKVYVFCANHFSYLDVAVIQAVLQNHFAFVGKSSVKNIPLLGYMFRKLHIQVDRSEKESRTKALMLSMEAISEGRSVMVFPEGGIRIDAKSIKDGEIPQMLKPFKDGAFSMAIENQVPIIPISLIDNYSIMPETTFYWRKNLRVVFHEPIETIGKTRNDVEEIREMVYDIIQTNINQHYLGTVK
jgi:1-acyl-sn-glycerol-3-phosphate acyltransferase